MAYRRARFGQRPRAAPALTSTLISIARQMQAQRDQNIMEAWQKGGTFEGQKVTDDMVLAHWRTRLKGVEKDDPLYDTYKNAVTQYEYAISESKMTAAYALHKKSDAQMVNFYLGWAKKIPKDSEFYRVLQRDAGQYMRAQRATSQADIARKREERYQNQQENTRQQYEAAGEYTLEVLRQAAAANNLIGRNGGLEDFDPSNPTRMLEVLDLFTAHPGDSGKERARNDFLTQATVFHDPVTGRAVTGADIGRRLSNLDPSFDGSFDLTYVQGAVSSMKNGLQKRIDRAQVTGHTQDTQSLTKALGAVGEVGRQLNAWPVEADYMSARQAFSRVWMSPTSTPLEKMAAHDAYNATLTGLAEDPRIAADDSTRHRLLAEAQGDSSQLSMGETFTGLGVDPSLEPGQEGDISTTWLDRDRYQAMADSVDNVSVMWTPGVTKGGIFTPTPGGTEIGAATAEQIRAASPVAPQFMVLPQAQGGPMQVMVTGANVHASATDERGFGVSAFSKQPIAQVFEVTVLGQLTTVYGWKNSAGQQLYSADPPWNEALQVKRGSNGIEVDLSPLVPRPGVDGKFLAADFEAGKFPGFQLQVTPAAGKTAEKQELVFMPEAAAMTSDPAHNALGPDGDPSTDFYSLTMAALNASPTGRAALSQMWNDPLAKQMLLADMHTSAKDQFDPKTGAWVPTDPFRSMQTQTRLNNIMDYANPSTPEVPFINRFQRDTTNRMFEGGRPGGPLRQLGPVPSSTLPTTVSKLPADQLAGTALAGLGAAFKPGTTQFRPVTAGPRQLDIAPQGTIRLPTVGGYSPPGIPAPVVKPYQPPAQTQQSYTPPSQQGYTQPSGAGYTSPYHGK